jgi:cell division septation protein DedD
LTTHAQDDGFHEIQLNGKQLVFLFMAATVVSVVIFLCGVLVGRGVRSAQDIESQSAARSAEPTADLVPGPPATPQSMSGSSATPSATPGGRDGEGPVTTATVPRAVPTDELRPDPPSATRGAERSAAAATPPPPPAAATPEAKPAAVQTPQAAPAPLTAANAGAPRAAAPAAPVDARTPGLSNGWVVQLAALNDRGEAEDIARRLVGKGYGAFVVTPASGNPVVYRVRVGTFKTKSEADQIGAKLKKEERFDPWITR